MKIVKENINFERGIDPKYSMNIGFNNFFNNLKPGDVLEIQKDLPKIGRYKGEILELTKVLDTIDNKKRVRYNLFVDKKNYFLDKFKCTSTIWQFGFDFFKENFKVIKKDGILLESMNFERGLDPKESMGIGKAKLIQKWLEEVNIGIKNYRIRKDFLIDTEMDVIAVERPDLFPNGKFPEYIRFNRSGSFDIDDCGIVSLEGCPNYVCGYFSCQVNEITNLEGFPDTVEKDIFIISNAVDFSEKDIAKKCYCGGKITADDTVV